MKRPITILLLALMFFAGASSLNAAVDPEAVFIKANELYAAGDYTKALDSYLSILDSGSESGNLYYNVGNAFFKLNKLGYAILCYDRALRLKPRDSDVRSNLEYARSLVDDAGYGQVPENVILRFLNVPYRAFSLNAFFVLVAILYACSAVLVIFSITNATFARRMRAVTIVFCLLFFASLVMLGMRYYNEVITTHGIVVAKSADARYEPIDKSTVYFKVKEGCEVIILKTKGPWRQIKRADGKVGWIAKDAVEPI